MLYLSFGFSLDEVIALTKEAISYEPENKHSKQKWTSPEDYPAKSGRVSYSLKTGLRVFSEMQNLILTFKANGIDVFVVSAGFKPVI